MSQRAMDWLISIVGTVVGFALSWPFWRDFEYWAESEMMWNIYFVVGFVLSIYVFHVFIDCIRTLFQHSTIEQAAARAAEDKAGAP